MRFALGHGQQGDRACARAHGRRHEGADPSRDQAARADRRASRRRCEPMSAQPHRPTSRPCSAARWPRSSRPSICRVRMEETLTTITDLAADELDAWELTALHDPRTWVRPVAAIGDRHRRRGRRRRASGRRRRADARRSAATPIRLSSPPARCARSPTRSSAASAADALRWMSTQTETTCYRHPGRATRVSCSSCGRPICPDCMTPSPVGMRCPECARQTTKVKRDAGAGGRRAADRRRSP